MSSTDEPVTAARTRRPGRSAESAELPITQDASVPSDEPLGVSEPGEDAIQWTAAETSYCAFTPRRLGVYGERFSALAASLGATSDPRSGLVALEAEHQWASAQQG